MKRKRQFGELELAILEVIKQQEPAAVRDVVEALPNIAYTTVLTVMNRLVEKGDLQRERDGRRHIYRQATRAARPKGGPLQRLKQRLFGDRSAAMISYLIDEADDLSKADLDALEQRIKEARTRDKESSS